MQKKVFCFALVLGILVNIMCVLPVSAKEAVIKDISTSDEVYSTVQWVIGQGYMSLTLGKFLPAKLVKRNEFAAIVTKLSGSGKSLSNPKTPSFKDVTVKDQFYRQIETAKKYMVCYKSKAGTIFKPNNYLTREDAMLAVVKIFGYDTDEAMGNNENTDLSLEDVIDDAGNVSPALVKYVAVGVSNSLMDMREVGDKIYFDPKKNITRKDLAILIYNAYQKKDYSSEEYDESASEDTNNKESDNKDTNENTTIKQSGSVTEMPLADGILLERMLINEHLQSNWGLFPGFISNTDASISTGYYFPYLANWKDENINFVKYGYNLNGQYNSFKAIIVPSIFWRARSSQDDIGYFKFYSDGKSVFDSGVIKSNISQPIEVNIDLTGVQKFRIEGKGNDVGLRNAIIR